MKRVFVDTSAWYAYVQRRDPDHRSVSSALHQWRGRLVTSNFVFDEVVTLVRARMGHAIAIRVGEALREPSELELIQVLEEDQDDAWAYFSRHKDKAYSFTDCTSFALMRRLGVAAAISTDHHFRQAGFEVQPG